MTIFISHASEDKDEFVRPLAYALKRHGLRVWYDEFSLKLGDSLRRSIDRGLASCTAGVVVLSPAFFSKEWPSRELDALYAAEVAGRTRILPIWHSIDARRIAEISPLLADRVAVMSTVGVEAVALEIANQFPAAAKFSGSELAVFLERCHSAGFFLEEAFLAGCRYRFLLMNAFKEEYQCIADEALSKFSDEQLENFPPELDQWLNQEHERLRKQYGIPEDVYLISDEPIRESHFGSYIEDIDGWASGTLSPESSARLVIDLDHDELDEYFILLGLPNFSFSASQRALLEEALVVIGSGFEDGYERLGHICADLRRLDSDA